jgi:phosphocarrier protein HPr
MMKAGSNSGVDVTDKGDQYEADVVVTNPQGIHLRNAAVMVRTAAKYPDAEILIAKDGHEVNGKSIMGVLTLVAEKGATLHLRTRGEQGKDLLDELVAMFADGFDEAYT